MSVFGFSPFVASKKHGRASEIRGRDRVCLCITHGHVFLKETKKESEIHCWKRQLGRSFALLL